MLLAQITNPAIGGPQGDSALGAYIGVAVKSMLVIGAVLVLLLLAWGAFQIITSGGDSKGQEKGRNIIQNAVIGLVILVALFPIIKALEIILNISILNLNFPSVTLITPALAFSGGSIADGAGGWPFGNLGEIRNCFVRDNILSQKYIVYRYYQDSEFVKEIKNQLIVVYPRSDYYVYSFLSDDVVTEVDYFVQSLVFMN